MSLCNSRIHSLISIDMLQMLVKLVGWFRKVYSADLHGVADGFSDS